MIFLATQGIGTGKGQFIELHRTNRDRNSLKSAISRHLSSLISVTVTKLAIAQRQR
ncbi:hypothetical protein [Limnofasciculus baicalensis]|uniref:Uncharacterized protein n=1 Tax=Limnofasciculus baicalensis BBK-W-15 TaxID=2699891 RepID=A0AAE3KTA8_9CYAN|nr:hypothetical protein [Limnofasciculus baicalensis]MCP2730337.1 hypothetical protein [Limnofasciculus baicalensis BBK-W-15]